MIKFIELIRIINLIYTKIETKNFNLKIHIDLKINFTLLEKTEILNFDKYGFKLKRHQQMPVF